MTKLFEMTNLIHTHAKAKGWWTSERSTDEIYALFISEISEATEEVRNGKPDIYLNDMNGNPIACLPCEFPEGQKPEGEAVEVADAFIRALDFAGFHGFDLNNTFPDVEVGTDVSLNDIVGIFDSHDDYNYYANKSPLEAHYDITGALYHRSYIIDQCLSDFILKIARYFKHRGWNLEEVVNLKVAYNQKRPYRHGGKLY